VALAAILAMKPEVLLLDEPTAGLPAETTAHIARILRANGLPCLIVSHDPAFLEQCAVHALYLQAGCIAGAKAT
jgi:cobalt/nickel transport system ATP-binding protein